MYYEIIQQFSRTLKNLDTLLGKAVQHAETKKFDVNNFMTARLAPDMFPFPRQVQIACDVAKAAAASLAGKEAPKFEDNEATVADLRERIGKTLSYLETFKAQDFATLTPKSVVKVAYPQGKAMYAPEALLARAIPNLFFHTSMAYALLRQGGADVGKGDFLGQLHLFDA